MKKMFPLVLIVLFGFIAPAFTVEETFIHSIPLQNSQNDLSVHQFGVIVTASGKWIIQPGPVFTEGTEEAGTELPYLLDHPKPVLYPRLAISKGWEGKAVIAVEIRSDGSVGLYHVMRSTGYDVLDEEVARAIRSWKFHPATKEGKPLRTCIQIPVSFQLKDESSKS